MCKFYLSRSSYTPFFLDSSAAAQGKLTNTPDLLGFPANAAARDEWHVCCPVSPLRRWRADAPTKSKGTRGWAGVEMRKRILLVEDDQHSRNGLQASLRAEGHGVEAVSDGWQGFRKIKEGIFDLAIVDLDLASRPGRPCNRLGRRAHPPSLLSRHSDHHDERARRHRHSATDEAVQGVSIHGETDRPRRRQGPGPKPRP